MCARVYTYMYIVYARVYTYMYIVYVMYMVYDTYILIKL